jgi:hypothetical protein
VIVIVIVTEIETGIGSAAGLGQDLGRRNAGTRRSTADPTTREIIQLVARETGNAIIAALVTIEETKEEALLLATAKVRA